MRISSANIPSARNFAADPSNPAVCVRLDGPKALIMWDGGYLQIPVRQIPGSWWTPLDNHGAKVPLRIKRPLFGGQYSAVDVEFVKQEKVNHPFSTPGPSLGSILLNVLAVLASGKPGSK